VPHLGAPDGRGGPSLLLPASALFGAAFLIGCDLVARVASPRSELPVGIVTAIVGGPVFLWLLFRRS
jgi:iron complex transport system permease protein